MDSRYTKTCGFALLLSFLIFPSLKSHRSKNAHFVEFFLALVGSYCALYLYLEYVELVERNGILLDIPLQILGLNLAIPLELFLGVAGILVLLEATRRAIGLPLVVVAFLFLLYSFFGQSMPDVIAHQGLSFNRLVGYQWLGGEAIFGIPISVSVIRLY